MTKKLDPIEEGRRVQAEAVAAQEATDKIRPTPSQEENDKAKLGLLADEDEDGTERRTKAEAAGKPGSYQTRQAKAD